jgi:hypothetical protein
VLSHLSSTVRTLVQYAAGGNSPSWIIRLFALTGGSRAALSGRTRVTIAGWFQTYIARLIRARISQHAQVDIRGMDSRVCRLHMRADACPGLTPLSGATADSEAPLIANCRAFKQPGGMCLPVLP